MKAREKQSRVLFVVLMVFYTIYAVLLFWCHPFVASAKEAVSGGTGNKVVISSKYYGKTGTKYSSVSEATYFAQEDVEIVGFLYNYVSGYDYPTMISLRCIKEGEIFMIKDFLDDATGYVSYYDSKGELTNTSAITMSGVENNFYYASVPDYYDVQFTCSGMKIFFDSNAMTEYAQTGSLDGMIKEPELDKSWYLKDIRCEVKADDSPSSEAGGDATYIKFFWLTDNLQEGDLLEIRTHNVLKKIGGDQISGFHDYITRNNNISAYDNIFNDMEGNERASYTLGQYDATKAWFSTVENKPLLFKSYETDIYYFRPYRNGKFGGWVKVSMRRATPTSSPYIDKVEVGDLDEDGNWTTDEKLTEENGGSYGSNQDGEKFYPDADNPFEGTNLAGIFKSFYSFMKSLPSLFGELPALVGSIVSFLPSFVIGFIAMGIVIAIILRIVGR